MSQSSQMPPPDDSTRPSGEQQRARVVLARDLLGGERLPLAGRGVPELRLVDAPVHVDVMGAGRVAARREDRPVRERGEVELAPPEGHRRRRGDLRRGPVHVDRARRPRRRAAAGDEDLAHVIEGVAAVVAVLPIAARTEALPCPGAGRIQLAQVVVGTRVEDTAIGRDVHPGIERHVHRPRLLGSVGGWLPSVRRTSGIQGRPPVMSISPLVKRRHRRVPAGALHVGAERPGIVRGVEGVGIDDAVGELIQRSRRP